MDGLLTRLVAWRVLSLPRWFLPFFGYAAVCPPSPPQVRFMDGLATLVAPAAIGKTPAGTVYWSSADNFVREGEGGNRPSGLMLLPGGAGELLHGPAS